jgi:rhodanese-related sulfurtransferase
MKPLLSLAIAGLTLLWVNAAPAGDPEAPEKYVKVDEVKALMDLRKRVVLIDVRVREQFDELHIRGARNIPLRELPRRLAEVPREDFVVLY